MANLLTSDQVKIRLGLETDDDSYDDMMALAMPLVTSWFEQYCDRGLALRSVVEEEFHNNRASRLYLWAYPIASLTTVTIDGVIQSLTTVSINRAAGYIYAANNASTFVWLPTLITVSYDGGYATEFVPDDLAQAYADAVGVKCGITPTEGVSLVSSSESSAAIRSIGLGGGALSVAFDTSASSAKGGISGSFDVSSAPVEVQNYVSVLNYYKRSGV